MTLRQPAYFENASHHADVWRNVTAALVTQGGVAGPYDLTPSPSPTGGMKIRVSAGTVFWQGTLPGQGVYNAVNDDYYDVALAGANATLPRLDLVVARLRDPQYGGSGNPWDVISLTGTPQSVPSAPTALVQPGDELICQVAVGAAATSVTADKIVSRRRLARFAEARDVGSAADRDLLQPYNGMVIYRTDLGTRQWYQGGQWYSPVVQASDGSVRIQGDLYVFGGNARTTTDYLTVGGNASVGGTLSTNVINAATASITQTLQAGGNIISGGTYLDRNGRDLLTMIGWGGIQADSQAVNTEVYLRKQGVYMQPGTIYGLKGTIITFVQGSGSAAQLFFSGGGNNDSTDGRSGPFAFRSTNPADATKWGVWRRMNWPAIEMWADIIGVAAADGTKADGTTWYTPNFTFPANRFSAAPCVTVMPYTTVYNNLLSGAGIMVYGVTATGGSARVDFPAGKTGACSFMVTAMYQG